MSEIPSGFEPSDVSPTLENKLSFAAFISSATIPFLHAIKHSTEVSSIPSSNVIAANLNLPIAAGLICLSGISEHRNSGVWSRLALAEGLVGSAGEVLLSVGSSALGSPEATAAGLILKGGSYIAEVGLGSIMHWRLNMDPRRGINNHLPSLPSATI